MNYDRYKWSMAELDMLEEEMPKSKSHFVLIKVHTRSKYILFVCKQQQHTTCNDVRLNLLMMIPLSCFWRELWRKTGFHTPLRLIALIESYFLKTFQNEEALRDCKWTLTTPEIRNKSKQVSNFREHTKQTRYEMCSFPCCTTCLVGKSWMWEAVFWDQNPKNFPVVPASKNLSDDGI